ncbi:MAG TPA: hypothetical protein PK442_10815 [Synergistales bacterium]|nr:hypothetical protein [Synergistales bacterium]
MSGAETDILLDAGSSSVKETAKKLNLSIEATSVCLERLSAQHLTLFSPCL